jgi:hypothetical protein
MESSGFRSRAAIAARFLNWTVAFVRTLNYSKKAAFTFAQNRGGSQSGYRSQLFLTAGPAPGYTAPMPIQFILPKKFTRAEIESHVDTLALRFQGTRDKKIIAQIAALNRLLARMDAAADFSQPRNRQ